MAKKLVADPEFDAIHAQWAREHIEAHPEVEFNDSYREMAYGKSDPHDGSDLI